MVGCQRLEQRLLLPGDRHVREVVGGLKSPPNDGNSSVSPSIMAAAHIVADSLVLPST